MNISDGAEAPAGRDQVVGGLHARQLAYPDIQKQSINQICMIATATRD